MNKQTTTTTTQETTAPQYTAVSYKFAKRWNTTGKDGKKTTHHEGKAVLVITTANGDRDMVAEMYKGNGDERLLPFADTFTANEVKVKRVELLVLLGLPVSDEAQQASDEAQRAIDEITTKRNAREVATVEAGREAYTAKATASAGKRFDRLAKKWATPSKRNHAKRKGSAL